ncbi:glutamate-gated chloride channel-like isoform X2 [Oratosquilla oratoria]|uniref:glutamate-gated chloride channel-like isoform X2 n=1 Tax=Oratosquilla oratoria TaxID=337810 RepID=UPI003F769342
MFLRVATLFSACFILASLGVVDGDRYGNARYRSRDQEHQYQYPPHHQYQQTNQPPPSNAHTNFRTKEKQLLDNILGSRGQGQHRYDRRIRPSSIQDEGEKDGDHTTVKINIMIRSINKIDDYHMEYSVQVTFREQWNDDRLNFNDSDGKIKYLTLTETDKIWMPDLFFKNEKTGHFHDIILPNLYFRIFPNGDVLYSIRISLTLSCPMDLRLYPLDTQVCQLLMASYGWTTEDLVFLWKPDDPVQVTNNLHLPRFTLEKFDTKYCNSKTNTGEYSCLLVALIFKRELSYYLIQYYIPCCMLVIVSWVSFWLDQTAVPARVALGVMTLLTMSTQTSSINQTLPPVSYTKVLLPSNRKHLVIPIPNPQTGEYSCLLVDLIFKREFSYYLIQYYIPCCMLVIVSWVSFWLDQNAVPARVALGVTTLLTMSTQISGINQSLPPVSYTKAIDVWTGVCLTFVFGALLEFALVNYASRSDMQGDLFIKKRRQWEMEHHVSCDMGPSTSTAHLPCDHLDQDGQPSFTMIDNGQPSFAMKPLVPPFMESHNHIRTCEIHPLPHAENCCKTWLSKFPTRSKRIDVIARITFPLVFALFNLVYWSAYLLREEGAPITE